MLTFIGSEKLEGDVRSFNFKSDKSSTWTPGQYLHLTINHNEADDRGIERWFTISSAPYEVVMTISTRIVADHPSSFKQALIALRPGDKVEADEPEGDFVLGDQSRNYIFVAGGIGITPFHSMIKQATEDKQMPNINLLHANSTADLAFQNEFKDIQSAYPNLKIEYVLSPKKIDKKLLQNTIQAVDRPIVYVSGPEPMVEAFVKELSDLGLNKDDIKADYFPGYEAF